MVCVDGLHTDICLYLAGTVTFDVYLTDAYLCPVLCPLPLSVRFSCHYFDCF